MKTGSITEVRKALKVKKRDDAQFYVDEGFKLINDEVDINALRGQMHAMDMKLTREMFLMAQGLEEDPETGELKKTGVRSSNAAKTAGAGFDRILNRYGGSLEKKAAANQTMVVLTSFPWEREGWTDPNDVIDVEVEEIESGDPGTGGEHGE